MCQLYIKGWFWFQYSPEIANVVPSGPTRAKARPVYACETDRVNYLGEPSPVAWIPQSSAELFISKVFAPPTTELSYLDGVQIKLNAWVRDNVYTARSGQTEEGQPLQGIYLITLNNP